ncbi:LOW QUALITY PROTEIN: integrin alpha-10 [Haemorhous mexicanus]|uniref:LOW QUALITY PROTEIN: integrin alpha-10 n=1 Tax=Haemorhous mexicanus TaxID=30427 RepID=UPI0028BE1291|nr:LOW QUALITY PROTEIN: integrin alpha-10 [Haemorhous mexicanus]
MKEEGKINSKKKKEKNPNSAIFVPLGAAAMRRNQGLLLALLLLPGVAEGFNIDLASSRVFRGPAESQFGYRVLQWGGDGGKWLLVAAPWDGDGQGDIYRCPVGPQNSSCAKGNLGAAVPWLSGSAGRLGMSLAESGDGGLLACAPLWSQECGTSVFSSGRCVRLDRQLRLVATVAPTAQRCPTFMDIVVLLDGSNSIYPWEEVQAFLGSVLARFFIGPGQTQVGVLQYGEHLVQEWALGQHPTAQSLLEAARNLTRQEGRETRTAMAIREACTQSFSPARGGRPGAARLLLVLTDGESHDGDELPAALAECDRRNITRYAIAVLGHYLRRQQDPEDFIREIKSIASDPDEKYFFNVTDEAALGDIVDALGDRIFSLEGTHGDNESAFELEMSQIGFSTHQLEDGILFGMVGAHGWEGGVLQERPSGRLVPAPAAFREEFPPHLRNHAAYLGYSVSSLQLPGGQRLLVAGAPRFQHKGKVVLFQLDPAGTVTVAQALVGDQIGSYFGSEVLALDLEGDGDSELLLVAAPSYLGGQGWETGRVYVYRVGQERLSPAGSLLPEPRPQDSRFGSALGAVPGLGQDGLAGAVVGAPLEDGHRGALYVFHSAPGSLLPRRTQRIAAAALGWSLRYFGISVDGRTDMDGDGLVDVAVGAQGAAVVLRSLWILQVAAALSVEPAAVSVTRRNCRRGGSGAVCLRARLCFRAQSRAPSAPRGMGVALRYNVSLEERSPASRAAFDSGARRLLQRRAELPLGRQSCTRVPFHVLDTSDYLRPLSLGLSWALDAAGGSVLDEAAPTSLRKLIPFFKDCGDDDECVTDLVLKATTDIVGSRQSPHIVRKGRRRMLVEVELENREENAYNTSLWLHLSGNLHFSSLVLQEPSSVKLECSALGGHRRRCSVGYPVFRSQAKVSFTLELEFSCSVLLDHAEVTLSATSDSTEVTPQDNVVTLSVPIRYEANVFLSSTTNLSRYELQPLGTFSPSSGPEFSTTLKVQNLGCYPLQNLTLHVALPTLGHHGATILSVTKVLAENVSCTPPTEDTPVVPVPPEELLHTERLECSSGRCPQLRCRLAGLGRAGAGSVRLLRRLRESSLRTVKFRVLRIVTSVWLGVQGGLLLLEEGGQRREVLLELLPARGVPGSLWILGGSALGGLLLLALLSLGLWRLGFFSHPKPSREEEEEEEEEEDEEH